MFTSLQSFILSNITYTPWIAFALLLLAGINIPISIDILLAIVCYVSANFIPEKKWLLFFVFYIGALLSALIGHTLGRVLSEKLSSYKFFCRFPQEKIHALFKKYGMWTFIIGRFIPFGVRNALFFTSGVYKVNTAKFILFDAIGCAIWLSIFFHLFYYLSQSLSELLAHIKFFNLSIFLAFSVTVIIVIWYKYVKKKNISNS